MEKTDIKSLPLDQLEQWVVEHGEKNSGQNSFISGCM